MLSRRAGRLAAATAAERESRELPEQQEPTMVDKKKIK